MERVPIRETARRLGVSEGAVRKRVARDTLQHDKDADGRVYVYLEGDTHGVDAGQDEGVTHESDALISQLRDENAFLRRELERKDAILLNMTEGLKALQPPQEPPESPEPHPSTDTPPQTPAGRGRRPYGARGGGGCSAGDLEHPAEDS